LFQRRRGFPRREVNHESVVEGEAADFQDWKQLKAGEPRLGLPIWGDEEINPPRHLQLPHNPLEDGNGREEEGQMEVPPYAEGVNGF
jgi:hypothetical protein